MAATESDFTGGILIHGSGVPNAYCGSYPAISLKFRIIFDRTGANNNEQIVWHTEGMGNWGHPTSGTYGYHLYAYIEMNDTGKHEVLTKNNTTGSSWWNHTTLSDTGAQSFDTTSNQAVMKIWVKSKDSCKHSGQYCYRADGGYTLLYAITVDLPTYETFYTVTYNSNGGDPTTTPAQDTKSSLRDLTLTRDVPSYPLTVSYHYSSVITDNISRVFNTWNTAANGTGTTYYSGGTYSTNASCNLYAQWGNAPFTTRAIPDAPVVVTYLYNGGSGSPATTTLYKPKKGYATSSGSTTVAYLEGRSYQTSTSLNLYPLYDPATLAYSSLPKPTRAGYAFEGWYLNGSKVTTNLQVSSSITLEAHWRPIPLHKMKANGSWSDEDPVVWKCVEENGVKKWKKIAHIYKYDGTRWNDLSV